MPCNRTKYEDTQDKLQLLEDVHRELKAAGSVSEKAQKAYERKKEKYLGKLAKYDKRQQDLIKDIEKSDRQVESGRKNNGSGKNRLSSFGYNGFAGMFR